MEAATRILSIKADLGVGWDPDRLGAVLDLKLYHTKTGEQRDEETHEDDSPRSGRDAVAESGSDSSR